MCKSRRKYWLKANRSKSKWRKFTFNLQNKFQSQRFYLTKKVTSWIPSSLSKSAWRNRWVSRTRNKRMTTVKLLKSTLRLLKTTKLRGKASCLPWLHLKLSTISKSKKQIAKQSYLLIYLLRWLTSLLAKMQRCWPATSMLKSLWLRGLWPATTPTCYSHPQRLDL
jgi:hypothetical protein